MFVGSEFLEKLLPVCGKVAVGEEMGFAYGLYLFPEVLIKHLFEAVLDDVVSGIEGSATSLGLHACFPCHRLTPLQFCAVGVSDHVGSCFRIREASSQNYLLFLQRTLGNARGELLQLERKELKPFNIGLRW